MHGQFIWYELTTTDVDAAKKFYPTFTGWGVQPFDNDYTMFTTGGVPIAGIFKLTDELRQQGVPPNWMPYVEVDNVDTTTEKAKSLGGQVRYGPNDVPTVGRIAVLSDPQGAVFGVYKPERSGGAWDGTNVVGRFSWHELMAVDYVAASKFYSALFGWEKINEMPMGDAGMYHLFGKGDKMYGGMFNRFGDMAQMHPFWLVYIHVKDVGKALASATKAGGVVQRPRMDIPGGTIAILGDPQGAGFALHDEQANAVAGAQPAAKKAAPKTAAKKKSPAKKAASKSAAKKAAPKKAASKNTAKAKSKAKPKAKAKAARKAPKKAARRAKKK